MPDKQKKRSDSNGSKLGNGRGCKVKTPEKKKRENVNDKIKEKAALAALSRQTTKKYPGLDWSISDDCVPGKKRQLAAKGVFFICPLVSDEILSRKDWKDKIKSYLSTLMGKHKEKAVCLMIHTLNPDRAIVSSCVETLCTYLTNLISDPNEPKYKKIRMNNRVFSTKVLPVEGALEFLNTAGFDLKLLTEDDIEQEFLIFNETVDKMYIQFLVDMLKVAEPIQLQVYRDTTVLLAEEALHRVDLPQDFYNKTAEDVRKEQMKDENQSLQLRTKAMKSREEERAQRKYKYAIVRVKFPDSTFLQGTFAVYENFGAVRDFVKDKISTNGQFSLVSARGKELPEEDDDKTLFHLKLFPAALLTFVWAEHTYPKYFLKPRYLKRLVQ